MLWKEGSAFVFGIDEAGRGCLAGPVCAAVCAWPKLEAAFGNEKEWNYPAPVKDSKQMTEVQREASFAPIREKAMAYGVGYASAKEIDEWNILCATYLAVARALEQALSGMIKGGLIDENFDPFRFAFLTDGSHPLLSKASFFVFHDRYSSGFPRLKRMLAMRPFEKCVVKGDSKVFSIASASVLAKVSRDRHMVALDRAFPAYEFAVHKGYSTSRHVEKLMAVGPCSEHRRSFTPVAEAARAFKMN